MILQDTSHGTFARSVLSDVQHIFKSIKLQNYTSFIDLGSGDGRIVHEASKYTEAAGIEGDTNLFLQSITTYTRLNFINEDFENHDLTQYDVIFMYPDKRLSNELIHKLKNSKAIVILYSPINLLEEKAELFTFGLTKIYVYDLRFIV